MYRKSIDEILSILETIEGPAAIADRARLNSLERKETQLALVKHRYENIRANIRYSRLDRRGRGRAQISAELPIVYSLARGHEPPEMRFPKAGEAEAKRVRQPKRELKPLLQSLRIYRYAPS